MAHEYKTLYAVRPEELDAKVNEYQAEGWDLWGNQYALAVEGIIGHSVLYHQVMVRFDPSGHSVAGKQDTALREPAGFSNQVPETPAVKDFRELGSVIGSRALLRLVPVEGSGMVCQLAGGGALAPIIDEA